MTVAMLKHALRTQHLQYRYARQPLQAGFGNAECSRDLAEQLDTACGPWQAGRNVGPPPRRPPGPRPHAGAILRPMSDRIHPSPWARIGAPLWAVAWRATLALTIVITVAAALWREADVPVSALAQRWAAPPSQWLQLLVPSPPGSTSARLRLHLRDEGPRQSGAPPIVLVHGTGDSLHTWDAWTQALVAQGHRVVRFDLPGFGLTGPHPQADYASDTYARTTLAVLDALALRQVVLVGNSLGGEVAWRTAALAPERVAALGLLAASGMPLEPKSIPVGLQLARSPVGRWVGQTVLPRPLVRASVRSVYANPDRVTDGLVDRFFDITRREGNRIALAQRIQAVLAERADGGRAAQATWATVRAPTLLLWGVHDRLVPPEAAQGFVHFRHPQAPAPVQVLLPDLGHVPHLEDPASSLQPLLKFLADLGLSPTSPDASK